MSVARLRTILQARLVVRVESTDRIARRVNGYAAKHAKKLADANKPAIPSKTAIPVDSVNSTAWTVRPIDLLHKIGNLTTPPDVNMARLSASWATRRYFWSIAEPSRASDVFRLSQDAIDLDFHQKTLLSDEFGIGFGGLVMEEYFGAAEFVDISKALESPELYQDIEQDEDAQPDYLMWSETPGTPYYVVECKGGQSGRAACLNQMGRGVEQVPSVVFGAGNRQVISLVIGTWLGPDGTTVYVVDPPTDDQDSQNSEESTEKASERTGKRSWRIRNAELFANRAWISQESTLLKWAGQYSEAVERDVELEPKRYTRRPVVENAPVERRVIDNVGEFVGVSASFPELGSNRLRLFRGVEEELLARLRERSPQAREVAAGDQIRFREQRTELRQGSPHQSVSSNGTCMIIDGL